MTDPITFTSASPRHGLPLLFAGQSQREFMINEAHARIDALLHAAIEGIADAPPATPDDGDCWLVGDAPSGVWAGHEGALASFQTGGWIFVAPHDGLRVLEKQTGQEIRFLGTWHRPETPSMPSGGSTVDIEARDAIADLVAILISAGILAQG